MSSSSDELVASSNCEGDEAPLIKRRKKGVRVWVDGW